MTEKVIDLFSVRSEKKEEEVQDEKVESTFDEIVEQNRRKKAKQEEERAKANKAVLRSYRLKD